VHRGGLGHRDPDLAGFDPTDPVTGALSRRAIETVLSSMSPRTASRHHVVVIDVDRFKGVNDNFGHLAGDDVLAEITRRLSTAAPQLELGRFGGDEFIGVLHDTSPEEAETIAVLSAAAVSSQPVALSDGRLVAVSVSIGVASCTDGDWRSWVARADAAMYVRKNSNRDDPGRVDRRR
jgi:two-component system, cell cycle response regulator